MKQLIPWEQVGIRESRIKCIVGQKVRCLNNQYYGLDPKIKVGEIYTVSYISPIQTIHCIRLLEIDNNNAYTIGRFEVIQEKITLTEFLSEE